MFENSITFTQNNKHWLHSFPFGEEASMSRDVFRVLKRAFSPLVFIPPLSLDVLSRCPAVNALVQLQRCLLGFCCSIFFRRCFRWVFLDFVKLFWVRFGWSVGIWCLVELEFMLVKKGSSVLLWLHEDLCFSLVWDIMAAMVNMRIDPRLHL